MLELCHDEKTCHEMEGLIAGSWEGHDEHYRLAHIGEREIAEYEEHLRENYGK